ncbi:MAG: monovalent cation/H(+) antiporter subunit G [Amylibacter sp.]|nr:monovalent cation/H(+) antiporter subunit G [Amylibacter sp.]
MNIFLDLLQVIAWICIFSGGILVIIGALGSLRFPDFWSRLHAASVTDSGGVILLLLGMGIHSGFNLITFKLLLIGVFLFITGPTSSHAVANAAWVSGIKPLRNKHKKPGIDK